MTNAVTRALIAVTMTAVLSVSLSPASATADPLSPAMSNALKVAATKTAMTQSAVAPTRYPYYTTGRTWNVVPSHIWGAGYLPGSQWYLYQLTGESRWRTWATQRQVAIGAHADDADKVDAGVLMLNTYRHAYRLTGDPAYRDVALTAAGTVAGHYNPSVGLIRARTVPYDFTVISDNIMNAELLFWGANNGGRREWRDMATRHALRTAEDFLRPDGSSYHYVAYSTVNGAVVAKGQAQGAFKESTWSRGHAWLIYGFAMAYRETGDPRLLVAARRATDYWAAHVPPDLVPYWDFDAPGIPNAPRDSSAAAIAAAGFVELARVDPDSARRASFLDLATGTLESLSSPAYLAEGAPELSVLLHGTFAANGGFADHGTSWGDYFFIEALMRLRTQVLRISGPNRYGMAVRASQVGFERADTVVVAGGDAFADALAASSLAGVHGGPVLLSAAQRLPSEVAGEIRRLGATRVYVVGGPRSVSDGVVAELDGLPGVAVTRIGGRDRYETAANVARSVIAAKGDGLDGRVFLVRGDVFADGLSASAISYSSGMPVLLTRPERLPDATRRVLSRSDVTGAVICGGTQSVTGAVEASVGTEVGRTSVVRLAGRTRYDTAYAIASWARRTGLADKRYVAVASGLDYPDGLCGGAVAGSRRGVLLLTEARRLSPPTKTFLNAEGSETLVHIFGGEVSLPSPVENAVRSALPEQ